MTAQALPLLRRIQVLLNTLVGEHHVRRPLLLEVCDLMSTSGPRLEEARSATLELLATLETKPEVADFDASIEHISECVWRVPSEDAEVAA